MGTIDIFAGAIEIGVIISVFMFGIATVQAYIYARSSEQDTLALKMLVRYPWLLC